MNRSELWLSMLLALSGALVVTACGDDDDDDDDDDDTTMVDGGPTDGGVDPAVLACRNSIMARETAVAAQLPASFADATEMVRNGGNQNLEADYAGKYRDDLTTHPGCVPRESYTATTSEPFVTTNTATVPAGVPADIEGYPCAAKVYTQPSEDTTKPIVILVHGNSSGVTSFEEFRNAALDGMTLMTFQGFTFMPETTTRKSLATRLLEEGYAVIGFDARVDLVATLGDYTADQTTGNPFRNIDHGWAVPMLQSLIKAVMKENPTRKVSLVGHSLGATVTRDALRRLFNEFKAGTTGAINPYAQLEDVVLASGAHHGVASGDVLCAGFPTQMRGTVGCEMGDRLNYTPTYFSRPNNGPQDLFGAPCADGSYAFGERDQCDGNVVGYTTITMEDLAEGELQDEFVSEASSAIELGTCVDNELISTDDYDASGYFLTLLPGAFASHFGSVRSNAGIQKILDALGD